MKGTGAADSPQPVGPGIQRTPPGQSKHQDAKLFEAAQEFESFFVAHVMKEMRKALPEGGLLHSRGEDIFRDLLDDQMGQDIAHGRGFGLADNLYRQMSLDEGRPGQ